MHIEEPQTTETFSATLNVSQNLKRTGDGFEKEGSSRKMERTVTFYVPKSLKDKKNCPLVLCFHGSGESGEIFRAKATNYAYDKLAEEYEFIVAYPDGYKGNWNDSRISVTYPAKVEGIDDISFTKGIIDFAHKKWFTCPKKTLVAGYSNGAQFAFRLALELGSSYIAGIAIHCANLPVPENFDCNPIKHDAIPTIILNGTSDPICPFEGGEVCLPGKPAPVPDSKAPSPGVDNKGGRGAHLSAWETAEFFSARFKAIGSKLSLSDSCLYDTREEEVVGSAQEWWGQVSGHFKSVVKLVSMHGEGHYVPTAMGRRRPLVLGPREGKIHAPREVIQFFQSSTDCFGGLATYVRTPSVTSLDSECETQDSHSL